jgi:Ni/Co efflux regulator RcnB
MGTRSLKMRKSSLALGMTVALIASPAAFAQYQGNDNNYGRPYPDERSYSQQDQYPRPNEGAANPARQYQDRGFTDRNGYNDRDSRGGFKWRPGQVLPEQLSNRVVNDWEERGLSRPPSGHQWVRVGQQFVLVRGQDGMIARILNFD